MVNLKNIKSQDEIINYWYEIRLQIQLEQQKQIERRINKDIIYISKILDEINIKDKIFKLITQIEKYDENIWEKIRTHFLEKDYIKVINILKENMMN